MKVWKFMFVLIFWIQVINDGSEVFAAKHSDDQVEMSKMNNKEIKKFVDSLSDDDVAKALNGIKLDKAMNESIAKHLAKQATKTVDVAKKTGKSHKIHTKRRQNHHDHDKKKHHIHRNQLRSGSRSHWGLP